MRPTFLPAVLFLLGAVACGETPPITVTFDLYSDALARRAAMDSDEGRWCMAPGFGAS